MRANFNDKQFMKDMNNLIDYSLGFFEGIESGKRSFFENLGSSTVEALKEFVDSMARVDPEMLHHVYEWNQTGSPNARLFDVEYTVVGSGLSIGSTFSQSSSVRDGSSEPFYDKARIMEQGIPVTISPKRASVLSFVDDNGEQVFTKNPVFVSNPGGNDVQGSYERAFNMFMDQYFTQAFLNASGILDKLKDLSAYKANLKAGSRIGRSKGRQVGYRWIVNAGEVN